MGLGGYCWNRGRVRTPRFLIGEKMSHPDPLYDDYNDYYGEAMDYDDYNDDVGYEMDGEECGHEDGFEDDNYDDSMDGDFDSAMRDAGWGTDEDYGCFGGEDY